MEKQGVGRGRRPFRIGLLIIFFLLFFPVFGDETPEEDGEEILELRIETAPANPVINNPWSIFVLVNHPRPDEVDIEVPRFPASLVLERVRTDTRIIQREKALSESGGAQTERWTRVEFLFTPLRTGTITLEPFEVKAAARRALSGRVSVNFRGVVARRYEPRFRWVSPAVSFRPGEKRELTLELVNWDPAVKNPGNLFQGNVPLNVILEEKPPLKTQDGGFRYVIGIIPLSESPVILEPFSFLYETYYLTVPGITVPVLPARQKVSAGSEKNEALLNDAQDAALPFPFPPEAENVFFLFRGEYKQVSARVQSLWAENHVAEALAEIRKNERDSPAGPFLAPLRREMEHALGLDFTENESWRPFKLPLFFYPLFFIIIFSVGALMYAFRPYLKKSSEKVMPWKSVYTNSITRLKNVTLRRRNGFITVFVLVFALGMVFLFLEDSLENFPTGRAAAPGKTAILRKTVSYRVPDFKGAVNDHFSEGQPANVRDDKGNWCFAETPDGRSGWVPRESVITY